MRDILEDVAAWREPFAVATVVETWRSAPRPAGAAMAVSSGGQVVGSVSGGCVEGALVTLCEEVLATGTPVLTRYGVADDDAFAVGLTCGGELAVFVRRVDPASDVHLRELRSAVVEGRPVALATVVVGDDAAGPVPGTQVLLGATLGEQLGTTGDPSLDAAVVSAARGQLAHGGARLVRVGAQGEGRRDSVAVLVEAFAPPPRMLVYGAIDFAAALCRVGAFLGYRVTVCDARPVFATRARFPEADEVVVAWPHEHLASLPVDERTVVCVLTHDPKFDVPLLEAALATPAGYIGVMGNRRTRDRRDAELRDRGIGEEQLARLRAPVGLDLGARTPEETAVSIVAEVIARRWGGTGQPLATLDAPIHREVPARAAARLRPR